MPVFTAHARELLRDELIQVAADDPNVVAAATTGSAALDALDEWSDIDLALCAVDVAEAVRDWSTRMYDAYGAVHHLDVYSGNTLFRVFLLANTLQVDIAFWSRENFGATGPAFRLLFGSANPRVVAATPEPAELVGWGWLSGLHARSSLARGRPWQAECMIANLRHTVVALACVQHGLTRREARGADALPPETLTRLQATLPRSLAPTELQRSLTASLAALRTAAAASDPVLEARVGPTLFELAQPAVG